MVNDDIEHASADELRAVQLLRLRTTVRNAYEHVPHYRRRFDAAGVHPDDLKSLAEAYPNSSENWIALGDAYRDGDPGVRSLSDLAGARTLAVVHDGGGVTLRHGYCPAVVLDHADEAELHDCGEIQDLMKGPLIGRAVSDEADADSRPSLHSAGQRVAGGIVVLAGRYGRSFR